MSSLIEQRVASHPVGRHGSEHRNGLGLVEGRAADVTITRLAHRAPCCLRVCERHGRLEETDLAAVGKLEQEGQGSGVCRGLHVVAVERPIHPKVAAHCLLIMNSLGACKHQPQLLAQRDRIDKSAPTNGIRDGRGRTASSSTHSLAEKCGSHFLAIARAAWPFDHLRSAHKTTFKAAQTLKTSPARRLSKPAPAAGLAHRRGARGAMRAAARAYMHSLERQPMLTKSSTSFAAFSITDLLAQRRERRAGWDAARTVRGGLYGFLYHGPFVHTLWGKRWGLERFLSGSSWPMVVSRVAADQLALLPVNMLVFCAWPALLTRGPTQEGLDEAATAVRSGWWEACTFGWSIWPFVHLINFKFVPLELRILVLNTVSIGVFSYATLVRDGGGPMSSSQLARTLTGSVSVGAGRAKTDAP